MIGDYSGRWLEVRSPYLDGPAFGGLVGTRVAFPSAFKTHFVSARCCSTTRRAISCTLRNRRWRSSCPGDPRVARRRSRRHPFLLQRGRGLEALRRSPRWSFGGDLITANDAAMLYVMTMKPGLSGSLLVVAATILFVAAARAIGHAFRAPVMPQNSAEHGGHAARRKD